jgi:4-carboxymuconolactone decarboxylase
VGRERASFTRTEFSRHGRRIIMADKPVLDLLARMTADSLEVSSLDPQSLMLVRIAALISVDAPPASYLLNLGVASDVDIDGEQVRGVLAAVAPIVGTARVASATGNIARALGLAIEVAELEEDAEADV